MRLSERRQYFSIFNIFQCKKINVAWCKKNKYHLQKLENFHCQMVNTRKLKHQTGKL